MKRRHPEITRYRVNSTTCLSKIYLRVPMTTNWRIFSANLAISNLLQFNVTNRVTARTTVMCASRTHLTLKLQWKRWIRNRSPRINSWLLINILARRTTRWPKVQGKSTQLLRILPRPSTLTFMLSSSLMMWPKNNWEKLSQWKTPTLCQWNSANI